MSVEARLLGLEGRWVPWHLGLARTARRLCRTAGQRAAVTALLELWQEQQMRSGREPTVQVDVSISQFARLHASPPDRRSARRVIESLVADGVVDELPGRGPRGIRMLSMAPIVDAARSGTDGDLGRVAPGADPHAPGANGPGSPGASGPGSPGASGPGSPGASGPGNLDEKSGPPDQTRLREESERAAPKRPGPGRTQLRLRLFAAVPGRAPDPEAKELLALAETAAVDEEWQRRAESVLRRLKEGGVGQASVREHNQAPAAAQVVSG